MPPLTPRTALSPMLVALQQAKNAALRDEVPVGAVIVDTKGHIIVCAHNLTESNNDPTAHAEMLAIQAACKALATPRLIDCDMYVTLEPCAMCSQAISFARIRRLYYGAYDQKGGGVEHGARIFAQSSCHHAPEIIGGLEEEASSQLLKSFFQMKR